MADTVVALQINIDAAESASSVKELKQAIKELETAALKAADAGDEALANKYKAAAGAAKDKITDLKKEVNSLQDAGSKLGAIANVGATIASGFQAATGAAALFGGAGKDIEKIMLKVQAATALAQGAQALANATEDIAIAKKVVYTTVTNIANAASKAFGISAQAAMAAATGGITILVAAVVGLIAYLNNAREESERLEGQEKKRKEDNMKSLKYQNDYMVKTYENQIKLLQAQGNKENEINKLRKNIANEKLKAINEELNAVETTTDRARELDLQRLDIENELQVLKIESTKTTEKKTTAIKELNTATKEYVDGSLADYNARISALKSELDNLVVGSEAYKAKIIEIDNLQNELALKQMEAPKFELNLDPNAEVEFPRLMSVQEENDLILDSLIEQTLAENEILQNARQQQREINAQELEEFKQSLDTKMQAVNAINSLSEIFYTARLANAKKGSAEEQKILKQQFETQKKMQIAMAIMNGAQSITAILSVPDFTLGVASAIRIAAAVAATAATVAKISSTKFDGGGGGAVSAPSGTINIPPQAGIPSAATPMTSLQGQQQQQQDVKVYVTETDISNSINRVDTINRRATIG